MWPDQRQRESVGANETDRAADRGDGARRRRGRLIYPVMLRSAVFAMLLVLFHLLEEAVLGLWAGKTVTESVSDIGGGTVKGILVVGFIMFIVLIPFFAANELGRVIGKDKLYEVFFVRRSAFGQTASRADAIGF